MKIRNIIGNNPFRVRNYVQGDDLDNDLVPLRLLRPKDEKFDNDEEFIEHFLKKKNREEKAKAELEMRKKKQDKIRDGLALAAKFRSLVVGKGKSSLGSNKGGSSLTVRAGSK